MCENHDGMAFVHNPMGVVLQVGQRVHHWRDTLPKAVDRGLIIIDNLIPGMTEIAASWQERWRGTRDEPVSTLQVPHSRPVGEALLDEIGESGLAIVGLGNSGAGTVWLSEFAADLAQRMPVAVVITERFEPVANARLAALGEPELPVFVLPNDAPTATDARLEEIVSDIVLRTELIWNLPNTMAS